MFETNNTKRKQADTTEREREKKRNMGCLTKKILKQNVKTSIKNNHNRILFKFLKNNRKQKKR